MRRLLLSMLAFGAMQLLHAQTAKIFELYAVAEGNFGTPNGDIFKVIKVNDTTITVSAPLYQTANNTAVGFDVIQDFEIYGNKAVWGTKSSNSRIVIANFPGFDSVRTFAPGGSQCLGIASSTKAYVSAATGNIIRLVDMAANTLTPVSDPTNSISSYATYMVYANGAMYTAISAKIVKIDTATNAVTSVIQPNLGTITGLQYDSTRKQMWIAGKSGGVSAVVRMDVLNNDFLNAPVVFTGVTNASMLRFCNDKLYFLSGKAVHIYNILTPNIPTTAVYTSTLGGSATGFAYGKSFTVDPVSGDFAIGHANGYASSSLYEVVNGTTFNVIGTGSITGCRIVNELVLKTGVLSLPVPAQATLPVIREQCSATLTPPTALSGTAVINGTTTDSLSYHAQGTYTVSWTYSNAAGSVTQTQQVIIADTTAPVPDSASLPALAVSCPYTVTRYPTATDNCIGSIIASTTSPLTYTTAGTFTITWHYTDSNANTTTQTQTIIVDCAPSSVVGTDKKLNTNIWPNPASDQLWVRTDSNTSSAGIRISLKDVIGKEVMQQTNKNGIAAINVSSLPSGVYYVMVQEISTNSISVQKVIINH